VAASGAHNAPVTDASPPASTQQDVLAGGRDALARHAWQESFDALGKVDGQVQLSAEDLEGLSVAAFFLAKGDLQGEYKERAFGLYEAQGNPAKAAYVALDLAQYYGFGGKPSIAAAWTHRAERLIGADGESYVHGYLALVQSYGARRTGNLQAALALAERAVRIGEKSRNADLKAYSLANLGTLMISAGEPASGIALLEEASIAAVNGELTPFTSGVTACQMIGACRDLTDYGKASEWIEATDRYCSREALTGFPGVCRIHRAEVVALGGAWDRAEGELEQATAELEAFRSGPPQADGYYAIGDIRRLKGDFEGAEAALREAHARGKSPQPALALVRLGQGNAKGAFSAIQAAIAEAGPDKWSLTRLLPAEAEIAIAAGDVGTARSAADQLTEIVSAYPTPALEASRQAALGRVLLAEGDPAGSISELRASIAGWRLVGAPYEVARVQALLGRALRALGDKDGAELELETAIGEFRRLGAQVDLQAIEREEREAVAQRSDPETARRTFMFTDIVGSTNLAEALGDQAWEQLLRWHDDMLRGLISTGGGQLVNSTGDGFFAAFDSAKPALDCAISIQRALRDHRTAAGFAPSVRIGLHSADATRRGDDYSGKGVHVAARVGALAGSGEIVATAETAAEAAGFETANPREVTVKGISEPLEVVTINWLG
jgi:class 3 adenylate cyclase